MLFSQTHEMFKNADIGYITNQFPVVAEKTPLPKN